MTVYFYVSLSIQTYEYACVHFQLNMNEPEKCSSKLEQRDWSEHDLNKKRWASPSRIHSSDNANDVLWDTCISILGEPLLESFLLWPEIT